MTGALGKRGGAHARRRRSGLGRIAGMIADTVLVLLLLALVVLLGGALLGDRAFTIRSGSMTPTIGVGDVVVDVPLRPLDARTGEVVTFRDPALGYQLVTHRVVSVHRSGGRAVFVTKGDANKVGEHWSTPVTGHLGREVLVVPDVGRLVADVSSPLARVIEVALFAMGMAWAVLRRVWRRSPARLAA